MPKRAKRSRSSRDSTALLPKVLKHLDQVLGPFLTVARKRVTTQDEAAALQDRRIPQEIRDAALANENLRLVLASLCTFPAIFLRTLCIPRTGDGAYLLECQLSASQAVWLYEVYEAIPILEKRGPPRSRALKKLVDLKGTLLQHAVTMRDEFLHLARSREKSDYRRPPNRQPRDVRLLALYVWAALQVGTHGCKRTHATGLVDELFRESLLATIANEEGLDHQPIWPSIGKRDRERDLFMDTPGGSRTGPLMYRALDEMRRAIRRS